METGDGWLVRLHPRGGRLSVDDLRRIADLARRHGSGLIDITARGNLQLRGVRPETHGPLVAELLATGLVGHHARGHRAAGVDHVHGPLGLAAAVLVDRVDAGHAAADLVLAADQRARALGRDQHHVEVIARRDHAEVHVQAVREQQARAGLHVRRDRFLVDLLLHHVRGEHRDQVGLLHRLGRRLHGEAVGLGLGFGRAARAQADGHVEAGIAQVQRMRAALAAVADDGDAGLGKGRLGHLDSLL